MSKIKRKEHKSEIVESVYISLGYWKCDKCSDETWAIYHKPNEKCPKEKRDNHD